MKDEPENGSKEQFVKPVNTKNWFIPCISNTARNNGLTSVLFTLFGQFTYHYTSKTTIPSWGFTLPSDKSLNTVKVEEETVQGVNN